MKPRILVPFDFSPAAEAALRWAAELQRSVGGGSIKILHIVSALPIPGTLDAPPLLPPEEEELAQLRGDLDAVAARLSPGAETEVVLGSHVGACVINAMQAAPTDLIVMGTHGRGGVKRMVLGSVADYAVRHATCPVVTMRVE